MGHTPGLERDIARDRGIMAFLVVSPLASFDRHARERRALSVGRLLNYTRTATKTSLNLQAFYTRDM